jgi:epoxyqueuosine reductase QueG
MKWNRELEIELKKWNVDFVHFVDISHLSRKQNKGFLSAVLFGVKCSPQYLKRVSENLNYVPEMVERNYFDDDEHYAHEMEMYRISDILAKLVEQNGFHAYSLSDENQIATNNFDGNKTHLPLKTLAIYAGLGWIGKNNLLVNKEFGCCQTWGGVLTDIPLNTEFHNPSDFLCGNCRICVDICQPNALKGKVWKSGIEREEIIDVDKCTTCLKCMVHCPWTQKYMNRKS